MVELCAELYTKLCAGLCVELCVEFHAKLYVELCAKLCNIFVVFLLWTLYMD